MAPWGRYCRFLVLKTCDLLIVSEAYIRKSVLMITAIKNNNFLERKPLATLLFLLRKEFIRNHCDLENFKLHLHSLWRLYTTWQVEVQVVWPLTYRRPTYAEIKNYRQNPQNTTEKIKIIQFISIKTRSQLYQYFFINVS